MIVAISIVCGRVSMCCCFFFRPREIEDELLVSYTSDPPYEEDEFHKCWISVVQGNLPCTQEQAVKLAALHYQAYFLDRTAVNSVVGFSR